MRTTVLGMGSMGHALAGRLLDGGHRVTVWNRTPGKAADLVNAGATEASSAAEASAGAEVVVASLSEDAAVRSVLLPGGDRLVGVDGTVVDCSTVSAETTRTETDAYGPDFVAAPILGAPAAVTSGHAVYAVAGPAPTVDRLEPVWSSLTSTVARCGEDPVRATVVKLLNNSLLLSGLVALSEAVATGEAAGLEADFLVDFLGLTPMVATGLHNRLRDMVTGDHDGWFPTPLGAKDVDLFIGLAAAHGIDLPLATTVRDRYCRAAGSGLADADVAGVIELLRAPRPSA